MKEVTLHLGDCLAVMRGMDSESVQCCVTSPPYWGLRDYGVDGQLGLEDTPEKYIAKMVELFGELRRVLRGDGTLWLNLGDTYAANRGGTAMPAETLAGGVSGKGNKVAKRGRESGYNPHRDPASHGLKHKDLCGIPWRVALALQADGWYLRQDIIWHKPNPMPESVTDRCTKAHEYIFLMSKSAKYYYDMDAIKVKAVTKPHCMGGITTSNDRQDGNRQSVVIGGEYKNKRSVWTISTNQYKEAHFATFPPKLIEPCILAGCPEGGVVIDPFCGSGTSGEVCVKWGRRFVGIELNPEYIKLAERRIRDEQDRFALFDGVGDTLMENKENKENNTNKK